MKFKDIWTFIVQHKGKFILTLIGFIAAILMLTIGFFRTLLIVLLTGLCFLYGYLLDKFGFSGANRAIADFFRQLLKRK